MAGVSSWRMAWYRSDLPASRESVHITRCPLIRVYLQYIFTILGKYQGAELMEFTETDRSDYFSFLQQLHSFTFTQVHALIYTSVYNYYN